MLRWHVRLTISTTLVALLSTVLSAAADVRIRRLELITVTDTSAALTWETNVPAYSAIRYGPSRGRLDKIVRCNAPPVRFHHCTITGLKPGQTVHYAAESDGATLSMAPRSPGRFTTLVPPPGKERFAFAQMTDTHVGQVAVPRFVERGRVLNQGVAWPDKSITFWELSVGAAVYEINAHKVAFTVIKGDITHHGAAEEFPLAKRLFDRLDAPYYVLDGNHDNAVNLMRTFGLRRPYYSFDYDGFHFIALCSDILRGRVRSHVADQLAWLGADLARNKGKWTFVFTHHPVPPDLRRAGGTQWGKQLFQFGKRLAGKSLGGRAAYAMDIATGREAHIPPDVSEPLAAQLRSHGLCAGVFSGHLHRNYVGTWPEQTGNLPYVETASTKEYPVGYAITRVFDGGYMQTYHTPSDPQAVQWSAMTHEAYKNIGYGSKTGSVRDRNFVIRFDQLDLTPRRTARGESSAAEPAGGR